MSQVALRIEELEERIAPSMFGNPSTSATPEVPAGSNPEPNGNNHGNGNPSTSANPEVPAGNTPQPNPNRN